MPSTDHEPRRPAPGRIRRAFQWALFGRVGVILASFLVQLALARLLVPAEYGVVLIVQSLVVVFAALTHLGLPRATLRLIREQLALDTPADLRTRLRGAPWLWAGSAVVNGGLFWALALTLGERVFSMDLAPHVGWALALMVLASLRQLAAETFRGFEDFRWAAFLGLKQGGLLQQGLLLTALTLMAVFGEIRLGAVFVVMTAAAAAPLLLAAPRLLALYRSLPEAPADPSTGGLRLGSLLATSLPMLVSDLSLIGLKHLDVLIVGALLPPADLAAYGVAKRLAMLIGTPLLIGNTALSSFIPDLHVTGKRDELERLVRGTATVAAVPSVSTALVMIVAPGFVLATVFGDAYRSGATALTLLGVGAVVSSLAGSCAAVLDLTGHQRANMGVSLSTTLLHVLLAPFVVHRHGVDGAAAMMMVTVALKNVAGALLVRTRIGIWTTVSVSPSFARDLIGQASRLLAVGAAPRARGS